MRGTPSDLHHRSDIGLTREHRFVSTGSREYSGTDWCHQAPVSLLGRVVAADKRGKSWFRFADETIIPSLTGISVSFPYGSYT